MQYWIRGADGKKGPFDHLQIRGLVATQQLTPSMELSSDGVTWHAAGKVEGLFPKASPQPILDFASPSGGAINPISAPIPPALAAAVATPTYQPNPSTSAVLWNPFAAANWSILFTPIFGSYLHTKNWLALGDAGKAKISRIWFWVSIAVVVVAAVAPIEDKTAGGLLLWLLLLWYIFQARKQISLVKSTLGKTYARRSFGKPIAIAVGFFFLTLLAAIASVAVIQAVQTQNAVAASPIPATANVHQPQARLKCNDAAVRDMVFEDTARNQVGPGAPEAGVQDYFRQVRQLMSYQLNDIRTEGNDASGRVICSATFAISIRPDAQVDQAKAKMFGTQTGPVKYAVFELDNGKVKVEVLE